MPSRAPRAFRMVIFCAPFLILGCERVMPSSRPLPQSAGSVTKAPQPEPPPSSPAPASRFHAAADLRPVGNSLLTGAVTLNEEEAGLRVLITIKSGKPGPHRVEVHANNTCKGPLAEKAGPLFDPLHKGESDSEEGTPSMGILGQVIVQDDGEGSANLFLYSSRYEELRLAGWDVLGGRAVLVRELSEGRVTSAPPVACGVLSLKATAHE